MGEMSGSRRMAEVRRLMRRAIDSDACQRCLSRSSSLSFSTLHRLCFTIQPWAPSNYPHWEFEYSVRDSRIIHGLNTPRL